MDSRECLFYNIYFQDLLEDLKCDIRGKKTVC